MSNPSNRSIALIVIALVAATVLAAGDYRHRTNWLNRVTVEIRASSAPAMARNTPSVAALWVKTESNNETHLQTAQWTSYVWRPFSNYRFDLPLSEYKEAAFLPDQSLNRIEITNVKLFRHGNGEVVDVPLNRVRSRNNLGEANRTSDSVSFWRLDTNSVGAIELQISDLLQGLPSPPKASMGISFLLFLGTLVFIVTFGNLILRDAAAPSHSPENAALTPFSRFGIIAGLVLCLAAAARPNSHPDEYLHVASARYYLEHWLPPPLTSAWVDPSYSHYGLTYLGSLDAGYLVAGRAALIMQPFFSDIFTTLRFFNASLLLILFLWSARFFRHSYGPWIFLLTPQLWYIFSAYNNDAWALFISSLLVGQVASQQSFLRKYLDSELSPRTIAAGLCSVLLSCLAILCKSNYLVVYAFFVTWLLYFVCGRPSRSESIRVALRIVPLLLIPFILRFSLLAYQKSVNGGNLRQTILAQADKFADPDFKPSNQAGRERTLINMKEKGVSVRDVLFRYKWLSMTTASFFGTYGWMMFYSRTWFYYLMIAGWIVLLGRIFAETLGKLPPLDRAFSILTWLFLPLMVALCFYFSWTSDFQPQGRYLFPFLPILFYLFHSVTPHQSRFLAANVWALFLASVYGFLAFGVKPLCN